MRILHLSDLHYTRKQFDWVASVAAEYELVVLSGDLLDIASVVEPDAQIADVLDYLAQIATKTTVIACSGNHDLNACNEHDERSAAWLATAGGSRVLVDGARLDAEQVMVTVCPWWDGPRTRKDVNRQLAEDAMLVGDRLWIWVCHAPPESSPTSWTGTRHYGDPQLVAWIDQHRPAIVLCGHIHEAPFASNGSWIDRCGLTWVFNSGRQIGAVPAHIEIDSDARLARWLSLNGVEERHLVEV